jgi:hypothetical protein
VLRMGERAKGRVEQLQLKDATVILLEECRMVLPGMQALFGFQLVAVFNSGFKDALSQWEQHLHLAAVTLVAVAIALIMTPAAYHRQAGARHASDAFITLCTRILLCAMVPLALGICIDFYLVAKVLWSGVAPVLVAVVFAVFVAMWFVLPRVIVSRQSAGVEHRAP